MLGRTNLLFVAGDNTSELAFTPDYILTSSSGNILKIEYINNLFFLFASDGAVLYGSDINSLQTLKNGNNAFEAKHIIFADGVYYMTKIEKTSGKAVIYKTADLISFEEITLKTGNSSYPYPVHGLFLNSKGEIVALIEENKGSSDRCAKFLLIADTLTDYQEESANFIEVDTSIYTYYITNSTAAGTKLIKDRIFTATYGSYSNVDKMITLDGTMSTIEMYTFFAVDYFFKKQSNSPSGLYYSLNGVDYISLDFSKDVTDFVAINVFEYDGAIALIYKCTENGETVSKLTTAATPKELIKATASAIPVTIDYSMQNDSNVYVDEYAYLGSTGGIVIKGKIDNAETERPDVVVIKGMAAKEALEQANDYTDEKYKNITNEVELHEETTRQYMENAFYGTPEGYAELVDTVSENKVKIDTIIEKADLRIKADASGEEIHLTDSDDDKIQEFALYGKAKQNTTQGNQLFDVAKAELNKRINIVNGLIEQVDSTLHASDYIEVIENEDYTLNFSYYSVGNYGMAFYDKDKKFLSGIKQSSKSETSSEAFTFTVPNGCKFLRFTIVESVRLPIDVQMNKGTTALPYEPYSGGIASPNPQYPQPIEVSGASGSVEVTSVCVEQKNKFNYKEVAKTWYAPSGSTVYRKVYTLEPNTPYTLSCDIYGAYEGMGFCFIVSGSNIEFSASSNSNGVSKDKPRTVTTDSKGNLVVGTYLVSSGNSNLTLENANIQLEKGTVVTEYQEFIETLATIPTENGLAGINDIRDEIVKYADGSGERVQKVDKFNLGSAVYDKTSSYGYQFFFATLPLRKVGSNVGLCTVFRYDNINTSSDLFGANSDDNTFTYRNINNQIFIRCDDYTDIDSFKTAMNGVYVYYELATPIHTPLTAEEIAEIEKLQTFYPVTNISNDADCGMSVKYHADSKNYIDRMVAEQVASIVANMNK